MRKSKQNIKLIHKVKFWLAPIGAFPPRSAHARPSAQAPINTSSTISPSGRKVCAGERTKREKNAVNIGHLVL